jgi:hypothetical protein
VLHVPSVTARFVLQLARGGVKCVSDDDVQGFMGVILRRLPRYGDVAERCRDIDANLEKTAFSVMMMGHVHDDMAPDDAILKPLEPGRSLSNLRFDRFRWVHPAKRDLQGHRHDAKTLHAPCPETRMTASTCRILHARRPVPRAAHARWERNEACGCAASCSVLAAARTTAPA